MDIKTIDSVIAQLKDLQFQKVIDSLEHFKEEIKVKDRIISDIKNDRELIKSQLNKQLNDVKQISETQKLELDNHKAIINNLRTVLK
jgi:hypothetical protein